MIAAAILGVVSALAPTGGGTRLELAAQAALESRNLWDTMAKDPPRGDSFGGGATLGATVFLRRVVDDDAAPSLQPFLQRASSIHAEAGGGSTTTNFPLAVLRSDNPSAYLLRYATVEDRAHAAVSADGFWGRFAYTAARLDLDYARWQDEEVIGGFGNITPIATIPNADSSELAIDASVAGGVRWRDLLVYAGWSVTPYRLGADAFAVRFWGGAFAGARAVVRRRWDLAARVDVLDGGARAEASATLWLRRRFGLSAGVEGGHGAFFDSAKSFDRAGGRVAVAWWLTPRFAATVAYAALWQATTPVAGFGEAVPEFSYVAHVVTLTLTSRPPLSRR